MMRVNDPDLSNSPVKRCGIHKCPATRLTPTPSWTGSSTTLIGSSSAARACAAPVASPQKRLDQKPRRRKKLTRPISAAPRAGSSRYRGAASSRNPWAQSSRFRRAASSESANKNSEERVSLGFRGLLREGLCPTRLARCVLDAVVSGTNLRLNCGPACTDAFGIFQGRILVKKLILLVWLISPSWSVSASPVSPDSVILQGVIIKAEGSRPLRSAHFY